MDKRAASALPAPGPAGCRKPFRWRPGLLAAAVLACSPLAAADPALYLEAGAGHRRGDFGTPATSTLDLAYGAVGLLARDYDLNLTVPVLSLRNEEAGRQDRASGLGDVLLRGVRRLLPETPGGASLDGGLTLKLPTADSGRGLGTGRPDLGAFAAFNQRWGRLQASLLGGWIQSPSAPADTRTGIPAAGAGLSWYAGRGKYSVAYQTRGAPEAGAPAPRELSLDVYQVLSHRTAFKASWVAGLGDGSPRTSVAAGFVFYP